MVGLKTALLVSVLSVATGGCMAHGQVSGDSEVSSELILVELHPGVWVIEDHREPVFHADGYFWLYRDDGWYRSSDHARGWVRFRAAPQVVVRIERPRQYVNYRAAVGHRVGRGPHGPISVRDRRDDSGWQDQREDQREEQQERREDKREEQQERREEKREEKAEKREDKAEKREDKAEKREDKRHKSDHKK